MADGHDAFYVNKLVTMTTRRACRSVLPCPTVYGIALMPTIQIVIPIAAAQHIVAQSTEEDVVALTTIQFVAARPAGEQVISRVAESL